MKPQLLQLRLLSRRRRWQCLLETPVLELRPIQLCSSLRHANHRLPAIRQRKHNRRVDAMAPQTSIGWDGCSHRPGQKDLGRISDQNSEEIKSYLKLGISLLQKPSMDHFSVESKWLVEPNCCDLWGVCLCLQPPLNGPDELKGWWSRGQSISP